MTTCNHTRRFRFLAATILSGFAMTLTLSACKTAEVGGGAVGGALGGLAGSQIGSGSGQIAATIAGAAAGAWIGAELAGYLSEEGEKGLASSTQRTAVTGQTEKWSDPNTGASGTTSVTSETTETQTASIPVKKGQVKTTPPLTYIDAPFEVRTNANVRGGPSTEYVIVETVQKGARVNVIGQVKGSNWYLIAFDRIGEGYVHSSLVEEAQPAGQQQATNADTSEANPDTSAGSNSENVETRPVTTETVCREIEQTAVANDGNSTTETVKACRGPNGWEVQDTA